jgi:hypothetical protein
MNALTFVCIAAALLALTVSGRPVCHNITGTCLAHGFECVSGEVVTHAQRCDGVEDCSDGTDEFMCEHEDHRPLFERTPEERHALTQATCVNCNCAATAYTVTGAWLTYGLASPTDISLMTGTVNQYPGLPCHSRCTTSLVLGFYKKNRICRGWLCCARQRACTGCTTAGSCGGISSSTLYRCY